MEHLERPGIILDAGAGNGIYSKYLKNFKYEVVSLDFSFNMITHASKLDGALIVGDMWFLPLHDGVFIGLRWLSACFGMVSRNHVSADICEPIGSPDITVCAGSFTLKIGSNLISSTMCM